MLDTIAVWAWPDSVRTEDPARMAERLKAGGIEVVIPYVSRRAVYLNSLFAPSEKCSPEEYEKRLKGIVEAAHRKGLKVFGCFDQMNTYETMPVSSLTQVREDGSSATVLCPANPETRDYILMELEMALTEFGYDGINLEDGYIYNNYTVYDPAHMGGQFDVMPVCYCAYCTKHAPIGKPEWNTWKQQRLTELIAAMAARIRRLKPGAPLSAAARMPYDASFYRPYAGHIRRYGDWHHFQSRDSFCADWGLWLREGSLDFACPMSYHHSDYLVGLQSREAVSLIPETPERIWMGLGLDTITTEYRQGETPSDDAVVKPNPAMKNDAAALDRLLKGQESLGQKHCVLFCYEKLSDEHLAVTARHRTK